MAPSTKYYTDDVPKYENNIEKAKELMKSAGVENIKLNFQYSYDTDKDTAMIIQQQLKRNWYRSGASKYRCKMLFR